MKHPFEVGETYENEKGEYEVVSIDEPTMVIQWTDGSTWEGSIALQTRILERIEMEHEIRKMRRLRAKRRAANRPDTRGRAFSGLVDGDFQTGIGGTSWRRRESLGGLLALRLSDTAPREFQSYTVYRKPVVRIASPGQYEKKDKQRQPRFILRLDETKATFGFNIEKNGGPMDDSWRWPKLLAALESGPELCQQIESAMGELGLDWRVWLPADGGLAARIGLAGSMLKWTPQTEEEPAEVAWKGFVERLRGLPEKQDCDLYLAVDLPKEEALRAGVGVADRIIQVYQALVPLYEACLV
jgi:hypothetical protein